MDLYDQRDSKGQMQFISNKEGLPIDHDIQLASNILNGGRDRRCQKTRATARATCNSAIQQLQRYAIVFRNVLASNQHAVVEEAPYTPLICCKSFLWTKKQTTTFGIVVGKSSWLPYAQQEFGWSLQLVDHQIVATRSLLSWPVRPALKGVPMDVMHHF